MKTPVIHESRSLFGLFALESARSVPLPLKAIDARFEVAGDCAQIVLEQVFEFDGPNPVDVIYTFPLPADAAVHLCEMRVGQRKVMAVAKPSQQARSEAAAAKAKGHRTALVETVRENLFELQLGNVQPGDVITMKLSYIEPLAGEGATRRLRIPVCPGVRYIPGTPVGADGGTDLVPDAGKLNPPRIGGEDPDAAAFFCSGTLVGAREVASPTHPVDVTASTVPGLTAVTLSCDDSLPDRDFTLEWVATDETLALMSQDAPDYLLCSVRVSGDLPQNRAPRDVFFLLDSSGSMVGRNWNALVSAVELALHELAPADRMNLTLFANSPHDLTGSPVPASPANVRRLVNELRRHIPDGGTEFTEAFKRTVKQASTAERPVIVVITDGQFGDERRASEVAARCGIEIHTVGIDANVNDAVLFKIARRTRGTCTLCSPDEELGAHMRNLVANLTAPRVERITATGRWKCVGNPPALRAGQSSLVSFRRSGSAQSAESSPLTIQMDFSDGSSRKSELPVRTTVGLAPALMAAKSEITALLDADKISSAVKVACRHNLLCEGVSYLAIDGEERVAVATVAIEQPSSRVGEDIYGCTFSPAIGDIWSRPPITVRAMHMGPLPSESFPDLKPKRNDAMFNRFAEYTLRIDCYPIDEWRELVIDVLTDWALKKKSNLRRIVRIFGDIMILPDTPDGRSQATQLLTAELLPFLPEAEAQALAKFLRDASTSTRP